MICKLLATTAVVTVIATGAPAQAQPAPAAPTEAAATPEKGRPVVQADGFLASGLIGKTAYSGKGESAQKIGKVNDLVLGKEGNVKSIVIGVGGFLGLGEKNVAIEYGSIEWAEKHGDRWIVVSASKDDLNAMPAFDRKPFQVLPAAVINTTAPSPTAQSITDVSATTDQSVAAKAPAAPDAVPTDTAKATAIDKSTLKEVPVNELRSEEFIGTTVYGANGENIGEIGDVVLAADQKVEAVVINVGGFLHVGEKEVAVGMDNLTFMADNDGKKYLYTTFSKEQLEAQPAYEKSTYAEKRDEQRLIMKP